MLSPRLEGQLLEFALILIKSVFDDHPLDLQRGEQWCTYRLSPIAVGYVHDRFGPNSTTKVGYLTLMFDSIDRLVPWGEGGRCHAWQ